MLSWALLLISIPIILLGAHGLYAYFYPLETLFTQNQDELFFSIGVPSQLSGLVQWMSFKGLQSFFIPVLFLACGIGLCWFSFNRGFHFSLPRRKSRNNHSIKTRGFRPVLVKIIFSLTIVAVTIIIIWHGYRLFTHQISALIGAIIFLFCIAALCFLIWYFRKKYIWYKPSFKNILLILFVIVIVFAFAGVEPFKTYKENVFNVFSNESGKNTNTSPVYQKITFTTGKITWEAKLKSYKWSGDKINSEIIVTNKGKTPADFPYDSVDAFGVVVDFGLIDSYGMWYSTNKVQNYDVRKIYPEESRTFKPSFTVNSRSGDVTLYVTRYTGTSKFALFKLNSPH